MDPRTRSEAERFLRGRLRGSTFEDVRWVEEVGSTNLEVLRVGRTDVKRSVLVADFQTDGRGRRGRTWSAPAGSALLMSVLLRDKAATGTPNAHAFWTVAAMSLAVHEALGEVGVAAEIKWPNDLLVDGRKVAGVLAEIHGGEFVVGVGINTERPADVPSELVDRATWVDDHLTVAHGMSPLREELAAAVLGRLDRWLATARDELVAHWKAACRTLGRQVRIEGIGQVVEGLAVDVDLSGALVICGQTGQTTHHVGDVVHLRPIAP